MLANVAGVHKLAVSSLTFSAHRPHILCSTSCDGTVCLWDVLLLISSSSSSSSSVQMNHGLLAQFQAHTLSVNHALFMSVSPNYLLTASDDRTIAMWDISSVTSTSTSNQLSSHTVADISAISVISGFGDAVNKIIELPCSLLVTNNNDSYESVIASACDDGMVYIHALFCNTMTETCNQEVHNLLTGSHMETSNISEVDSISGNRIYKWKLIDKFWVSTSTVNDLILLPQSRILLTASEDCAIRSWKLLFDMSASTDDRLLASLDEFENPVNHIALVPLECFVTDAATSTHAITSTSASSIIHHIRPAGVVRPENEQQEEQHCENNNSNNIYSRNNSAINVNSNIRTPYLAGRQQPLTGQVNMQGNYDSTIRSCSNNNHSNNNNIDYEEANEEEEEEVAGAGNTNSENINVRESSVHHIVHPTLPYSPSGQSTPIWVIAACSEFVFGVDLDPTTGVFGSGACSFVGHSDYIRGLEFTANNTLLTVSDDTTAMEWNVASNEPIRVIKLHESEIMSSAINASGDVLATGSESGEVRLWKLPFAT